MVQGKVHHGAVQEVQLPPDPGRHVPLPGGRRREEGVLVLHQRPLPSGESRNGLGDPRGYRERHRLLPVGQRQAEGARTVGRGPSAPVAGRPGHQVPHGERPPRNRVHQDPRLPLGQAGDVRGPQDLLGREQGLVRGQHRIPLQLTQAARPVHPALRPRTCRVLGRLPGRSGVSGERLRLRHLRHGQETGEGQGGAILPPPFQYPSERPEWSF